MKVRYYTAGAVAIDCYRCYGAFTMLSHDRCWMCNGTGTILLHWTPQQKAISYRPVHGGYPS